jgi:chemotaxis protein CheD
MASLPPPGFEHRIVTGMAEMVVTTNRAATLVTYSLGSCVGVSIYDPVARVGGLIHFMLPDSSIAVEKARLQPAMFVDTGLPRLLEAAGQLGLDQRRAILCVAGGAQILDEQGFFNIGRRNIEAVALRLRGHGLAVAAQELGGMVNRTMYLRLATGEVRLKVSGQSAETILWRPQSTVWTGTSTG